MIKSVGPQQQAVYPKVEPSAPPSPILHSHDQEISQIKVKEGFFSRFAKAIKSIFGGKESEVKNNIKEAKKLEKHKATKPALERIQDHKTILSHLKKAEEHAPNRDHWKIDLQIAQEHYAEGEFKEALIQLNKIPPKNFTREMTYFKAVVLKKMDNFLEAQQLYEQLIEAKRPPGKMTKAELEEELKELQDLWFDKVISDEEIQIVNDVMPLKKQEEVAVGMAPHVKKDEKLDYFDMNRIPDVNFDQNSKAFKYMKANIKNGDNTEILTKAGNELSVGSEKWKWTVRVAKESDLLARKPGLTEVQRKAHYERALSLFNHLKSNDYSFKVPASALPQLSFIKGNLLLNLGRLDEAANEFRDIKKNVDPNTPLGRDLAAEPISKLIEESDQKIAQKKIENEKRIEEEKQKNIEHLVKRFETKWFGDFYRIDMVNSNNSYNEFLKNYGQNVKVLNFEAEHAGVGGTFDIAKTIEYCPNLTIIRFLDAKSTNTLIKLIGQGKVPHLEGLDLSYVRNPEEIDLALLAENLICTPHFKGINLSGINNASEFIDNVDQESGVERLTLSRCQLTPEAYAAIPVKFPQLKLLNLSEVKDFEAMGHFINHLNNPIALESLDLSNKDSWDRQTLLAFGDKLVNLPKLNTLKLEFVEKTNFGVKSIHEILNELFAKLITGLKEGSHLESLNLRIGDYTLTPDNVLGKAMRKILQDNLSRIPNLKTLVVNGFDWGPAIAEMHKAKQSEMQKAEAPLVEQLNANKPVKALLKEQNMTWVKFQEFVKQNQQAIKSLNFDEFAHAHELTHVVKDDIYNLMTSLPNLVQISARDCFDVADIVLELIAEDKLKQVEIVNLSKNELTNSDAIALAHSMDKMPKLKKLILSENLIHDEGAKALAEKLKPLADFEELDIELNIYGQEGQKAIQEAFGEEIPGAEMPQVEEVEPGATVEQFEGVEGMQEGSVNEGSVEVS